MRIKSSICICYCMFCMYKSTLIAVSYHIIVTSDPSLLTCNDFTACVTFCSVLNVNSLINCKFEAASSTLNLVAIYMHAETVITIIKYHNH